MTNGIEEDVWTTTIQQLFIDKRLTSHQCAVYNKDSVATTNDEKCGCQRPIRHHSFDGDPLEDKPNPEDWNVEEHTKPLNHPIYVSTPSHKVSFYNSFCIHYKRPFSSITHLVLTMFL
jgi:hypothetical protein